MKLIISLLLTTAVMAQASAMSKSPESYVPPVWNASAEADQDAVYALANGDLRLLAYTTRDIMVPGIEPEQKSLLSEQCGLRMMQGFGDVVRSDEQLQTMKAMREYATEYNKIVAPQCSATKSSEK